mmetsp:Transcript_7833/g.26016  ORF Transcript_7833/g.26016 Transcript_7833/m.26016 type:complete len:282 (-) Transcript_7833:480-1325(-)|eukprot:CAMPEP_0170137524 /NCGR_PEP_ID=MMETSP0033_2-20121228/4224_1 /TAXON_ID=195969 /ORGANISM="Dolichomastix tenuilepis, Strain CCMP3274" /LENGTH=281 /DNA_ID=CAMNT_0010373401 /DNA_START=1 /DNA_END=846 /DNA_ORIENTATION=-
MRSAVSPALRGIRTASRSRASSRVSNSSPSAYQIRGYLVGPIEDKDVVVTGANRGLGLEWTRVLLSKGNRVVATTRDASASPELAALAEEFGDGAIRITELDIASPDSIAAWAASLKEHIPHVDVLISNAGVTGTDGYSKWDLEDMTSDEMQFVFQRNTIGPMLTVQQLRRVGLLGQPGSLVANVTSKVGSVDDNGSGRGYAYRASKSALNIINKSMSIDLAGEGVQCVLLHPGWVRTRMTEGRGLIDADESVAGMLSVLEGAHGPLNGEWYDYAGKSIPW